MIKHQTEKGGIFMAKKIILKSTLAVFALVVISGCGFVADGPFGWVYTDHTVPIAIGTAETGSKIGKACIRSFLGMISVGNGSIEEAMTNGGINEIFIINKENLSILGTYTSQCTVVRGE